MGGIGRYTLSLLENLLRIDSENKYFFYFSHLEFPKPIDFPDQVHVRKISSGMIDERFDQMILPTLLKEDRIDLYHNPTFAVPLVRTGAKLISTVHDVVFRRHPSLVEPRLRTYLDRATTLAARNADRLITVSEFSRGEIARLYEVDIEQIEVIPNGVSAPIGGPGDPKELERELEDRGLIPGSYALYVGRIEEKKNITGLLRAWKRLSDGERCQGLKLALVGSVNRSEYPVESRIRELGLENRVQVLGYIPDDLLEIVYQHALFFVYPSLYEGFGFPPLEAMVRGIPSIVSNASSLPEVVGSDALLVDPTRPEELADAMVCLRDHPEKRVHLAGRLATAAG
jgi:glycosyltransferase involved in cell wall biosynthesis